MNSRKLSMIQLSSLPAAQHHLLFFLSLFTYASHLDFCLISIKTDTFWPWEFHSQMLPPQQSLPWPALQSNFSSTFLLYYLFQFLPSTYHCLEVLFICLLAYFPLPPPDSTRMRNSTLNSSVLFPTMTADEFTVVPMRGPQIIFSWTDLSGTVHESSFYFI